MLDSIYHMALKLLKNHMKLENIKILPSFTQHYSDIITLCYEI